MKKIRRALMAVIAFVSLLPVAFFCEKFGKFRSYGKGWDTSGNFPFNIDEIPGIVILAFYAFVLPIAAGIFGIIKSISDKENRFTYIIISTVSFIAIVFFAIILWIIRTKAAFLHGWAIF